MRLGELVAASLRVGSVSGRLEKIELLASALARLEPGEIPITVAFLSGETRQGRIGIGAAAIRKAWDSTAASQPSLDLQETDRVFQELAAITGPGAAARRAALLAALFARATEDERAFLSRLLFGELRQGALEGLLLEAIARAAHLPAAAVRRAAMLSGDLREVAAVALSNGQSGLDRFSVRLLQPVQPMLAEPADDIDAALARLGDAALEYKLDGARIQAHKSADEVRVFSRNLRDVTVAVPEVVEAVRALPERDVILDGEVIAFRPDGRPHPFQVTMRRFGRKLDVARLREELPVQPFFFDLLLEGDRLLLDEAQAVRFKELSALLPAPLVVPSLRTSRLQEAEDFVRSAFERGHEGVMAKDVRAGYAAGSRGHAWLKIKQAHTLDLVVLAAEWGHGRRRGWLSNLHLGARDPERGAFVMLGKTFKGLTDEMLAWQTEALQRLAIARDDYAVHVRPELVVEVAFNDVQESPQYPGGLALRFARVKRYRPDKPASEADTLATVQAIHRAAL